MSEAFMKSCELACAWFRLANEVPDNDNATDESRLGVGRQGHPVERTAR